MRVALRCDRHRHAFLDTDTGVLEIHCRKCSKAEDRPVYHPWELAALLNGAAPEHEHEGQDQRGRATAGE